jgi:NAD(P)-dependent dehydrogenase (short-subunit alcohol dehydrogenase family)
VIDTLDDASTSQYVDSIVKQAGGIDIVLDAAGPLAKEYGNGKNAMDLSIEEFMVPLATMVRSRFITARAAARHMIKRRCGVIIFVTGSPARAHVARQRLAQHLARSRILRKIWPSRSAYSAFGSSAFELW